MGNFLAFFLVNLPFAACIRIFDIFFALKDNTILFRIALAILFLNKNRFIRAADDLVKILSNIFDDFNIEELFIVYIF